MLSRFLICARTCTRAVIEFTALLAAFTAMLIAADTLLRQVIHGLFRIFR